VIIQPVLKVVIQNLALDLSYITLLYLMLKFSLGSIPELTLN